YNGLAVTKISVTSTNVQFPPNNFTPRLLDGKVEPISGDLTTIFNFTVNYSDADNNRPDYIRLTLNETSYDMQPSDPTDKNYVDGVIYNFIAPLPVGNYSFYFNASDSLHPIGYPQVGKIIGPNVTYKNDNIPLLSDGEVTPIENYESVYFIFKVNYTDLDNNEPIYINVTISGVGTFPMSKQDPLDLNYMDGCIFNYSTLLDVGKYTYYFNTSDDGIIDVGFPPNNPLIGPNVTISPLGIFDGMFIEWSGIYSTSYSWNGREVYSYVSGSNFHVSESLTGIYNTITDRNIDIETRTVSSAGSETFYFWANNYHEIFCIPKSTRMFDIVPIATPWKSEYDFNVTGEKIINILGLNLTCWELSGPQNSTIYYEKYSGLLINATLYETPSDLFTLVITNTSTEFQENKNIPQLLDGKVEPIEGNLTTFFNFTVNYTDVDNNRPDYIRAIINETVYEMTPLDPWDKNYIDGVLYHLNILLPLGNYTFYFNTSDGWNHVRFPDPGELIGPNVTYLNENNPILSNGVVTPIKGFDDTLFTFEVNYTDLDNNEPVYTNITIEGVGTFSMMKQDPYDLNFIDGCIFWFNTTLDSEIYSYYFNCSDGVFPASDGPYTGLVVARTLLKNYTMIVDYPYEWINATTGVRCNMAGQDDAAQMFYLPFRFKFYNETFDQIYVCTNGFVSFTYQTPHYNVPFPIGTYPYMIAPFWEDLRAANPCNIFVRNLTSPNRVVIEWKDYYTYPGSLVGTFEIILYESGDIIFNYDYLDYTSDYTCGLNFGPDTKYFNMFTGLNSSIDNFSILFYQKPNIYYPELKSGSVIPGTGYQATEFNFSVIYTDLDNDAPLFVNVLINGTPYQMEMQNLTDNNYTDGCIYQYLTYLSPGMYNYSFECNDGSLVNSTIIYTGLNVTEANYYAPILTNGIVNPPTGDASTLFVFRINYTDIDNNTPEYVNITINSTTYAMVKQNSMDTNYMDGCIFIFNTILSVGTYVYYFNCSDGVFTTVDGPYIGPLVEEPSLKNYTMVVDYTYEWIDATTGVRCSLNEVDDGAQMFNLPFNFTFYNETFDRIYVCTNGFVSFTYQTTWFNVPFPTASNPYMIAPFWDDLRAADPCNIFVKNLTSPNRVVIEWQNYRTLLGSLVGTFEIILFESGDIIFNYDYLDYASSYTCGLNYGPDTRYFNSFTGLNTSIDDFSILFTYQNVTEEIPSGHPSSPPLFLPPREDQSLIFIIIIIIGAVAAAVGTLLYLRFWKKPEKRAFIKRPKKALAEKKAITTNGTRSIEKKVKESKIQESTEISESVVEEEKPVTKKLPEMEIKEVEPIPDEEIQFIQNLEKEELIEYVSNFEKDLLDLLPPEHPILSESKQWITDITNYPLSNLTQNDARKLIMDMKKWEKEIFKSNKTGN
ncbi:MAG: nidogen-like domain-containing protein, partial [Candidatus Hodarchaeota archaeon]